MSSIRLNAGYNLLGSVVTLIVILATLPMYLEAIGQARYGALAITWLLLNYFNVFSFGIGRAAAQQIASNRHGTASDRGDIYWSAGGLALGLGLVGGVLVWILAGYLFAGPFRIEAALRAEILVAVPILIIAVPISTTGDIFKSALESREQFLELNLINVTESTLAQVIPLLVALFVSTHMALIIGVVIVIRFFSLLLQFQRSWKHLDGPRKIYVTGRRFKVLLQFGGWVAVSRLVGPLMTALDRFALGVTEGAKDLAVYSIPYQLAERSTVVPTALTSSIFPVLASSKPAEAVQLAVSSVQTLLAIMTPAIIAAILLLHWFFSWWISGEFADSAAMVGCILLVGFWFNGLSRVSIGLLQAMRRPHLVAVVHVLELLPYLAALYLLLLAFGIVGAALGFALRAVIDFVALTFLAGIMGAIVLQLLVPVILLLAAVLIASANFSGGWLAAGLLFTASAAWAVWQAPDQLRKAFTGLLKK